MVLLHLYICSEQHHQGHSEAGGTEEPAELGPADPGCLAGGVGTQRRGHYGHNQVCPAGRKQDQGQI